MEAPMSHWFASVPQAFDSVAFATRFQFETLSSQVRYYKRKYGQHRALVDRMKNDAAENKELKRHANGARTNSSPRSVMTPLGPDRLTLPPSHQQPSFTHRKNQAADVQTDDEYAQANHPGSRRFALERYAYVSPTAQKIRATPLPLSHAQSVPMRQGTSRRQLEVNDQPHEKAHTSTMAPPPTALLNDRSMQQGFRPAAPPHPVRRTVNVPNGPRMMPTAIQQPAARHPRQSGSFRPPPTPVGIPESAPSISRHLVESTSMNESYADQSLQSNRFLPTAAALPTQRFIPSTPSGHQRFSTPAPAPGPGHARLMRTNTDLSSRSSSRAAGAGQRMPFIPGGQANFG
ncbi:hypothetical protein NM688_g1699 [Phlebia brevispora]|uniref:Uncharacterized protein n=1 Tax=Phlebia brevispora TaxID=194682 RepID=A0ACC1TAL0_9APHY|nr:hypothetical protein NM688_g1699 [Phlebia brevispora]